MEISKIIAIGLTGTVFAVLLKKETPQLSMLVSGAAGILIFLMICTPLGELLLMLKDTAEQAGVTEGYFSIILKVIGIAYLTQFGEQLCADAGENTIASKVELAGKVLMMVTAAPVLTGLLKTITGLI